MRGAGIFDLRGRGKGVRLHSGALLHSNDWRRKGRKGNVRGRIRGIASLLTGLAVLGALLPAAAEAAAPVPSPAVALPAVLDSPAFYEPETGCDPAARPGATALSQLLLATYGPATIYTTRACTSSVSEHFDGRAVDWMHSVRDSAQREQVAAMLDFLLAPGADGTPQAMARRLGIMYIIWNNRMIRMYDPARGWTEYQNCESPTKAAQSLDTSCHRNHVHFSLSWDGAAAATSWWTGQAVTRAYCANANTGAVAGPGTPALVGDLAAVPGLVSVSPRVVLDTAGGAGVPQPCRLLAGRSLPVNVLGSGVLSAGARAAALEVTVRSNAPTRVAVWSSGATEPRGQIAVPIGEAKATILVPLSSRGTAQIATSQGAASVKVRLLGYLETDLGAGPEAAAAVADVELGPASASVPRSVKPGVPRAVRVVTGKRELKAAWRAPAKSGSGPITDFRVTARRVKAGKVAGSCSAAPTGRRCTVQGLRRGVRYWVSVRAVSAAGTSAAVVRRVRVR